MFNRVHTPIFKISTSYLNFHQTLHLGKISQLSYRSNLVQYLECRYSRFPYSREGIEFTSVLLQKPIRVKRGSFSYDYVVKILASRFPRHNFHGS
jgi:hypothetical protein